jgi:4-diphosphocytidyl-2-C-methyl-D-erythritol kinase
MRLLAPAKVNLHLRVGPRDGSGYHPLLTWMCTVGLFDTLTLRQDEGARENALTLTCDDPSIACDETNLVHRAARTLIEVAGSAPQSPRLRRGLSIHLSKHVPVGGGLGGGSSDAARTLVGLNRLWYLDLPLAQLQAGAAHVGSDVPFFLNGPSAVCSGHGEVVAPVRAPRARWALLVLSGFPVPTRDVYARFDELGLGDVGFGDAQPPWQEWADLSAGPLLSRLRNDLEPAAFALVPQLGRLRDALELSLARVIRMTGSGGTLFTLFDERREAEVAAQFVRTRHLLEALAVEVAPKVVDDLSAP